MIYSLTAAAGSVVRAEIAPQAGEASVTGRADKFFGTTLEQLLKDKAVENAVVVGSAGNGAVLYTAFQLNLRGYTVVVAQDGISAEPEFPITLTRWQLLNQPGFTNADNKPLSRAWSRSARPTSSRSSKRWRDAPRHVLRRRSASVGSPSRRAVSSWRQVH